MKLTKTLLSSMTLVGLSLGAVTADASLAIVSSVGGAPGAGVTKWNLDGPSITLAPGVSSLAFIGAAQAVTGSSSGLYAAPYLSGSIWYDESSQWVRGDFERDGAKILYQLDA